MCRMQTTLIMCTSGKKIAHIFPFQVSGKKCNLLGCKVSMSQWKSTCSLFIQTFQPAMPLEQLYIVLHLVIYVLFIFFSIYSVVSIHKKCCSSNKIRFSSYTIELMIEIYIGTTVPPLAIRLVKLLVVKLLVVAAQDLVHNVLVVSCFNVHHYTVQNISIVFIYFCISMFFTIVW